MNLSEIPQAEARLLVHTYQRPPVVFTRGEGVYLFDRKGKRYLDLASGIAVTALGHSDPEWAAVVADQAGKLTHVSNLFHTASHVELAKRLVKASFADRVFFTNSGAEANEAALKFARKWAGVQHGKRKTSVVAFTHGFHGRTYGALSLTHKPKYREPFAPLIPEVTFIPFNNLDAASQAITDQTCAVFVEPVQGEGGVKPADPTFLQGLRTHCNEHHALLIFDEVQCGLGRTGTLWAHQGYGVTPDIMTLAKPLAGGLPIGATLVTDEVAQAMEVGDHGSTFSAGPLICRAAQVVFDRISHPMFLETIRTKGKVLMEQLQSLPSEHLIQVRGAGLLIGVEFDRPVKPLIQKALDRGLIVINAGENVLRFCPPLIITQDELEDGLAILRDCISSLNSQGWELS